ncbi:MAG TPA: DUF4175 family protein, partial [Hyphomicrobiaceae bacterium]|nr:DUF4175 family protein [Hyphomicrobiaceae bacterium]
MSERHTITSSTPSRVGAGDKQLLPPTLERKIARARWALFFERLWPRFWLFLAVAGLFLLVSIAGLWLHLDETTHKIVLAGFVVAGLAALVPVARVAWPAREEAIHRIERVSGVPHRPASSYA